MAVEFRDHPFWDFSLAVYGADGVSAACIALQDRLGADVNLLLFCAWIGASGRGRLTGAEIGRAVEAVGTWNREAVCGLRAVRRWMREARTGIAREHADGLRRRIVDIEVQCEHAEQLALAHAVDRKEDPGRATDIRARDVAASWRIYLDVLNRSAGEVDCADLGAILAAALPAAKREIIEAALAEMRTGG